MTWITLSNGKPFDFTAATMENVTPQVIAGSLANQCRFAGHTPGFYSVAEHSWLTMHRVTPADAYAALMHDAHEAVIQDIVRPLKTDEYRDFEAMVQKLFADHFGFTITDAVIEADDRMLASEGIVFFGAGVPDSWGVTAKPYAPYEFRPNYCDPSTAKSIWLEAFYQTAPSIVAASMMHASGGM